MDKEVEDKLFKVINNVKEKGVGIIYISHNLNEIFKLKGRVTILRDGKKVSTDFVKDIDRDTLITRMIGAKTIWFGKKEKNISNEDKLEIKNYSSKNVVENISFEVKKGEVFGIGGLVGSGRTELLRMLFGADKKAVSYTHLDVYKRQGYNCAHNHRYI